MNLLKCLKWKFRQAKIEASEGLEIFLRKDIKNKTSERLE